MIPLDEFRRIAGDLKDRLVHHAGRLPERVVRELGERFPGLQPEMLRRGWIPVSQGLLNEQLHRHAEKAPNVESVSLQCRPGHFLITVHTKTGPLSHTATVRLFPERFEVDRAARVAVFTAERNVEVEGRNTLGRVTAWVAEGAFAAAVRRGAAVKHVHRLSEGVVELDWPRIIVHLDRIEQVRRVLDYSLLGFGLLDVLSFGPLRVEKDYVYLKVERARRAS